MEIAAIVNVNDSVSKQALESFNCWEGEGRGAHRCSGVCGRGLLTRAKLTA